MSKHSRILLGLAVVLAAPTARAQRTLQLDDALHVAYRNNRDLQAAKARVEGAHAAVLQSWSALLPTGAVQGKYTHNNKEVTLNLADQLQPNIDLANLLKLGITDPNAQMAIDKYIGGVQSAIDQGNAHPIVIQKGEQLDFAANVAVPLIVPWGYPALNASKSNEGASKANFQASVAQVLYSTAQTYWACAGADELVDARRHAVLVAQKALDNARARLEAGVVNKVEVSRAELQLIRQQQALLESQDTQASNYRALGTIMDMHEPVRVVSAEYETPLMKEQNVDNLAVQALKVRPEILALDLTLHGNELTASSNLWRWAPTLSAFGNFRGFNYAGFSGDQFAWAVGLQLDWIIYDGGIRDANRKLAIAQGHENQARLSLLRDQVRDDVYNASRALKTRKSALEASKRSVLLSKQTLDLVQVQHDAGTATQLDLLQAQDNLVAAEVALAQSRFDLALSALSLERLSGAFPGNQYK